MQPPRIAVISLGCPKALVDTEVILTRLLSLGYTTVDDYEQADLVLINTCGFINEAIDESCEAIEEALARQGRVIITGCLGARREFLLQRFEGLLAVTGPAEYDDVIAAITHHLPLSPKAFVKTTLPASGVKLTPRHYAYVKISEGCSHRCSFCIIPSLRGPLRSRPLDSILEEAKRLVADGVRELVIVAQDTIAYGSDCDYPEVTWEGRTLRTDITTLCSELAELGVWIRLHYLYPYPEIDAIVDMMAQGKVLPYLDIPLQHAAAMVLRKMNRPGEHLRLLEALTRWRAKCPALVIRSTFIVGFPGETEADFDVLLDFITAARMDRVGAFKYSPVDGAAANALPDPVDEDEKEERLQRFMDVQGQISAELLSERVGRFETVRVDDIDDDGLLICRSSGEAPDIDGVIYVEVATQTADLQPGDEIQVKITDNDEHDLWATLIRISGQDELDL